ncbi:MAG: hypothetical protein HUJ80_06910 [Firmicutes bacterium]|nr:hypothetical protein [Bacillota bacterium]
MKSLAEDYPQIEVRCYTAGVDTEYLPKYGAVTQSVLIINEAEAVWDLSKAEIRKVFQTLAAQA